MFVVIAKLFYPLQSLYPESVSTITGMCLEMKWTTNMVPWPGYWEGVAEPHPPVLDVLVVSIHAVLVESLTTLCIIILM